jgi:hypothetical protein
MSRTRQTKQEANYPWTALDVRHFVGYNINIGGIRPADLIKLFAFVGVPSVPVSDIRPTIPFGMGAHIRVESGEPLFY